MLLLLRSVAMPSASRFVTLPIKTTMPKWSLEFSQSTHLVLHKCNTRFITKCITKFALGYFNWKVHHKDWLTYSGETDRPGELCYKFSISNDLTQMVTSLTLIPDCNTQSHVLWDLFISSGGCIFLYSGFPSSWKFRYVVMVSIDFTSNSEGDVPFLLYSLWLLSYWLGHSLWSFMSCLIGEYFKLGGSAATEFCEWVQVEIDVCIPLVFSTLYCCHSS